MAVPDLAELRGSEHFANLALDGLDLLIPQSDIQSIEPATDITPPAPGSVGAVGEFTQGGSSWPLYALSPDLAPLAARPENHRTVVLLKHPERPYGLLCRGIHVVEGRRLALNPVPPAMAVPGSAVLGLALAGGEVRCVSTAAALDRRIRA